MAYQAKTGMVHSVSGWTRGVQVKLWDPFWERVQYLSAFEVCSRQGTIQIHVYLTLPYFTNQNQKLQSKAGYDQMRSIIMRWRLNWIGHTPTKSSNNVTKRSHSLHSSRSRRQRTTKKHVDKNTGERDGKFRQMIWRWTKMKKKGWR